MGKGKTSSAIGKGIKNLGAGKSVNMIQFLKGSRENAVLDVLKKLEPDMKVFRFEKHMTKFSDLSDAEKEEELVNINNGKNFARKVLSTGSCDMLILNAILPGKDFSLDNDYTNGKKGGSNVEGSPKK